MTFVDLITDGALEVWEKDTDLLIEWEIELPPLFKQNDIRHEYNQWSSLDCTLYSSFWALSDLKDYELTKTDIKEIVNMSYERGRQKDKGWSTALWVKCVCDWWNNKHPDNKAIYFRIDVLSNNFLQALKLGYTVVLTFKGNSSYSNDHWVDWVVDWVDFKPSTRWHATTSVYLQDEKVYIKDSYKWRKKKDWSDDNYYRLADIVALVKNWVYYPSAYLIMSENAIKPNIDDLKRLKAFELKVNNAIAVNSELWHLTSDDIYKSHLEEMNNVNRSKLIDVQNEMKKLT